MNGRLLFFFLCHCDNIDPRRRDYLTEKIPSVSRLSYSPPPTHPRLSVQCKYRAIIRCSSMTRLLLCQSSWCDCIETKRVPRPVIELKKKKNDKKKSFFSAAGNFTLTRKTICKRRLAPRRTGQGSVSVPENFIYSHTHYKININNKLYFKVSKWHLILSKAGFIFPSSRRSTRGLSSLSMS